MPQTPGLLKKNVRSQVQLGIRQNGLDIKASGETASDWTASGGRFALPRRYVTSCLHMVLGAVQNGGCSCTRTDTWHCFFLSLEAFKSEARCCFVKWLITDTEV